MIMTIIGHNGRVVFLMVVGKFLLEGAKNCIIKLLSQGKFLFDK